MLAVTGANGNLGRRLLRELGSRASLGPARAEPGGLALRGGGPGQSAAGLPGTGPRGLVRSAGAVRTLQALELPGNADYVEVDYLDVDAMSRALAGCTQVVHLVGIIKESGTNRYVDAHERTASVLAEAAVRTGVQRIVCLSILGASEHSANACLRSRGAADAILLAAPLEVAVLRVPMVLGEADYAARALASRARRPLSLTLRAASLEQPIYAGDVVAAICAALGGAAPGRQIVELAGPESLTRRELTTRAAKLLGLRGRTLSLPLGVGLALAGLLERTSANPPVTRAMLGVLDHDDRIDGAAGAARLGINLTPLDEMLRRVLSPSDASAS